MGSSFQYLIWWVTSVKPFDQFLSFEIPKEKEPIWIIGFDGVPTFYATMLSSKKALTKSLPSMAATCARPFALLQTVSYLEAACDRAFVLVCYGYARGKVE